MRMPLLKFVVPLLAVVGLGAPTFAATSAASPLPAGLQVALYGTLSESVSPAHRIARDGCATLPGAALRACFDARGAHFRGQHDAPLSLRLVAYGRAGALRSAIAVTPQVAENRVSYRHGNLTEWWRALPVGFEQGFTISRRPAGQGKLVVTLASSAQAAYSHGTLAWGGLHYGRLAVIDAHGNTVPATLADAGHSIRIAVNDTHAVYPVTIDPLVWLEQEATSGGCCATPPAPGHVKDAFGGSVDVKGDLAVIGAPITEANGVHQAGEVFVFTRSSGQWNRVATLAASGGDQLKALFGESVAIADPYTILIGANGAAIHGVLNVGAVYVFHKNADGDWVQAQRLLASDGKYFDEFGYALAVDGNTAVVGAHFADPSSVLQAGKAYVFTRASPSASWTQAATLAADDPVAYQQFGRSVAISGDTIFVGAPDAVVQGKWGAAYLFKNVGGTWEQAQLLNGHSSVSGSFGYSVAIEGNTAVVGDEGIVMPENAGYGATYVYSYSGGTCTQTASLSPRSNPSVKLMNYGQSVAISGDTVLVGNSNTFVDGDYANGTVYVFQKTGGTWNYVRKLAAYNAAKQDYFGADLAWDGSTALIGADGATPDASLNGAAYFVAQANLALAVSAPASAPPGGSFVSQAIVTNSGDSASPAVELTVAVPAAASFVSATATSGTCSEDSGVVTCKVGQVGGNAGTATANVTLKASGSGTILNTASVARATPAVTASAATTIGGNTPPVAKDGALTTEENKAASGTLKASDADGDALTFAIVTQPGHGEVKIDDVTTGSYTYTPAEDYTGSDSFTFKANDGTADSNTAKISITVKGTANHPPVASNGSLTTEENTPADGKLKATDPDGDALTFSIVGQPGHGSVAITDASTGAYTYTPTDGYSGHDSFTFKASDGVADSNTATVSVAVKATNKPPVASNGSLTTDENEAANGTLKASDPNGDALTFAIAGGPSHGSVQLTDASTGAYTYTPANGYSGSDSFTFKASDGTSDSNVATISITVKAKTPPPPPPHDGGGGSFGWLALFALLALAFTAGYARRRRS